MSARSRAATFTIGDNVYVGTGSSPKGSYTKDFWEYDAVSNSWSQKADFAGTGRELAVGFSIGNKGYIGTGLQGTGYTDPRRDFWEYNPSSNSWLAKADYPFAIFGAVGFSINGKGYIATGYDWTQLHGD